MKVANKNLPSHLTKNELLEEAKEAEGAEDWKKAESLYEKITKTDPHNESAYNRLMIIYRKQKEPGKELAIIKKAINAFENMYAASVKTRKSKKVSHLSNAFLKLTGLADKNGKLLYLPAPLDKWERRKILLEKKLKK
jgi:tetratricopeptide (TPR) repeat protein